VPLDPWQGETAVHLEPFASGLISRLIVSDERDYAFEQIYESNSQNSNQTKTKLLLIQTTLLHNLRKTL